VNNSEWTESADCLTSLLYAKEKNWDACVDIATTLVKIAPERANSWVHRAYSLRRAKGGALEIAMYALLPAVDLFPKVWLIPYNLACYCSMLGRLDEAQGWFKKASAMNEKAVHRIAIDDPDLKPLLYSMSGTMWKRE
jgi:tetratricopeptide (TPR) repeat protein